jgi:UDPglucose 6-dehydrogenase
MKISFANQLGELCEAIPGARASAIADAIGRDHRIGPHYLQPATAFGGPCFPRDNRAIRRLGVTLPLAEATDVVNRRQIGRIVAHLQRIAPGFERVGVAGLAYKPQTTVTDGSVGVELAAALQACGCDVYVHDPMTVARDLPVTQVDTPEGLERCADVIVITTAWPDYARVWNKPVLDCWGVAPGAARLGEGPRA